MRAMIGWKIGIEGEKWLWSKFFCYVVYVLYLHLAYHRRDHANQYATSLKEKKRNPPVSDLCQIQIKSIREAINNVAEALRDGNGIVERGQACVCSEEEVFAELVDLGVD